jgi:hypothetical protein
MYNRLKSIADACWAYAKFEMNTLTKDTICEAFDRSGVAGRPVAVRKQLCNRQLVLNGLAMSIRYRTKHYKRADASR